MNGCQGWRVLVVEDDYVIATDMVALLRTAGALPIGPVGWEDEALAFVSNPANGLDLAILDVDLHGTPSYRVADALAARGVPTIFTTGFGSDALPAAYRGYPRLQKPVGEHALMAAIRLQDGRHAH
jgi:DNA-binding response OmpR family regulator